ncbi:MAG: Asp-tRNA(Asn)/Glu-tRNA(Gln) amidotransferase subunit GatC [Gemmatimonadetes bacterium]|mgnify:FL=1|jgi:aspartyl-tRNA(Asn)/glutamyl-tRNA(Gln) amidotransferase subunit C|nr:Asp-tRNA(Asn)/Glu-tRNA(Gln) amidotransferase subunit GatC [Gemmatimonadota bacterium]MBT6146852.1 Asp-tRNA(Asn)/Glu-tRNA(Gln) amidotransferase subunit GatC [Gemmatimonadota bacterium]
MAVTIEDVRRVAALARLELSPGEEERLTIELSRILDYMEKLNELDTEGVEPTAHITPDASVFRADTSRHFEALQELLAQAPDLREQYFRVPRIID